MPSTVLQEMQYAKYLLTAATESGWAPKTASVSSLLTVSKTSSIPENGRNNQIWEIIETPDSCLWIGTFKGDLYLYKDGGFSSIELPKAQDDRPLRRLVFKDEQVLRVQTRACLLLIIIPGKLFLTGVLIGRPTYR
jgi:hypothetical protein